MIAVRDYVKNLLILEHTQYVSHLDESKTKTQGLFDSFNSDIPSITNNNPIPRIIKRIPPFKISNAALNQLWE